MKRICALLFMMLFFVMPTWADGTEPENEKDFVEIHTAEDLMLLTKDPAGNYRLMEDLDLTDIYWFCPSFSGTFDGNGHSLLNLTITTTGEKRAQVQDGNQKNYDAAFAGFFGMLERAEIRNLHLVNLRLRVETDEPCMAGGLAGYAMDSTISGCSVTGKMELRAHQGMFGLGGMVGYGVAMIDQCSADTTLICVDTDADNPDEQFLGGIYGTGFMSVKDTQVSLQAYISEHGFVHSGGIAGMMMQYPIGMGREAVVEKNRVQGKITFFEHNRVRRAYCKALIGELMKTMNFNYWIRDNATEGFLSEEVRTYDRELRPETCAEPDYTEEVIPSGCDAFGYTAYTCKTCGYSYRDHYMLHSHTVTTWQVISPATAESEGESEGFCDGCGFRMTRIDPKLPEPPETTAPPETTQPENVQPESVPPAITPVSPAKREGLPVWARWCCGVFAVLVVGILVFVLTEPKGKHLRKKR